MRVAALLGLIAACVSGCSIPEGPTPGSAYVLEPEGAWTATELEELAIACDEWRVWSDGALDVRIGSPGTARVVRGEAGPNFGRVDPVGGALVLDPDGLAALGYPPSEGLRAMAENLMALAAQMAPHDGPEGILSRGNVTPTFTADDRASCRAAGFCR